MSIACIIPGFTVTEDLIFIAHNFKDAGGQHYSLRINRLCVITVILFSDLCENK